MEILFYILLVLSIVAIMDSLAYIIAEQHYKKIPNRKNHTVLNFWTLFSDIDMQKQFILLPELYLLRQRS